ncbi:MAG: hypothetical protein L0332_32445 [Chloroflexi bacterium]|nr:hypothetical protein [Chloroflexota bacterium]MCI0646438.1 hypothetical protein [Chloroflexota bacterium]MCI0731414.1 hypothetical protein [Chloroflexota bacterium]
MAYEARLKEVLEALEKSNFDAESKEKIRRALDSYFRERERMLGEIAPLLEPGRTGPCLPAWLARLEDAMKMTHEAFKGVEVGQLWLADIANEEYRFFFHIHFSRAPVQRDKMVKQTENLRTAMKEFENKWQEIKNADQAVDEKLKKVAEEYEQILAHVAGVAAETEKEAREKMASQVLLGTAAVSYLLGAVGIAIRAGIAVLGSKLSEAEARKLEIFALFSREEQVFAVFKETRDIVAEFLEENDYPQIKDAWDDGEDAAEALQSAMNTAGQKSDAAALGEALKDELEDVFSAAEREYKEFANKHQYLFFGPLGASYYQELAEDDTWKQFSENWKKRRADFDELLRERTLEASPDKILEVSLEGFSDDEKTRIYYELREPIRELLQAWNKWKESTDDPNWALESRERLKSTLDKFR